MRKNSNLPSLQLSHSSSVKHHSYNSINPKDNVKFIESKINRHENQIERNQKVILSLTNQFRLLKDELRMQQQENQEVTQMYRKTVDQNQKLTKITKQLKLAVGKLEKQLQDKKVAASNSKEEQNNKEKQLNEEIKSYKEELNLRKKQIKVLQATNSDLIKQMEVLKKKNKELSNNEKQVGKSHEIETEEMRKSYNRAIMQLQEKLNKQAIINKELEEESSHYHQILQEKDQKSKQLTKTEIALKEAKEKLVLKIQEIKLYRDRLEELERTIKTNQQDNSNLELSKKIQELQMNENQLKMKVKDLLDKSQKFEKLYEQEHKMNVQNEKKLKPLRKVTRNRHNLQRITKSLKQSIICEYCKQVLDKPVTNIPCGHSYCLGCKKGYEKECKRCNNVKREAVYRNQLMDEIIEAFKGIKDISDTLAHFSD